ncbi:MAG: tocopherol cyclase family protein [Oscillospiraceae bacterium]|nr:tocopherol cyclase family protein [Oscillospiraceae bacterium]
MSGRFEGWYYKHNANGKTLALIPGKAVDKAFVQVVTDSRAYNIPYSLDEYHLNGDVLRVGGNIFSKYGVTLDIQNSDLMLSGEIKYSNLTPIHGDIMGPFRFFPMECRHGIISMNHTLTGAVMLNGEIYDFTNGCGYIESDSGRSFPQGYTWVQCNDFENCSITTPKNGIETAQGIATRFSRAAVMCAVARIPFYGLKFWGCICVVHLNGREYRLATYNGVKILRCEPGVIALKRGKYRLIIEINANEGHMLPAPRFGKMSHAICESLSCAARFRFMEGNRILFDGESNFASYEYEPEQNV